METLKPPSSSRTYVEERDPIKTLGMGPTRFRGNDRKKAKGPSRAIVLLGSEEANRSHFTLDTRIEKLKRKGRKYYYKKSG